MANYYAADFHIGHINSISFNNRPFNDIEEMEESIIKNWNNKVTEEDDIWILGDMAYRYKGDFSEVLVKLKGKKHLIVGNHDTKILKNEKVRAMFESIDVYKEIVDNGRMVVLFHYPILEWNRFYRDSIHIYGHIHNNTDMDTYQIMKNRKNAYNAGVDVIGFEPCTLDEVIEKNEKFFREN